ncbi:MAG: DinB family protein [Anaerolineales bacterium]|nr:DinB family protein [Anaerolineales bacterium]
MQGQTQSTLEVIYENWRSYNKKLCNSIAPLTNQQISLQPAAHMWPLGQLVQHIISVRAGWFSGTLQDADEAMNAYMLWGQRDSSRRSAVELVQGLDETWAFIEARLQRWTPADCARTFPDEWDGQKYELSRSWVIYHVMEHDLHHGGEISLLLGMNGLQGIEL